VQTVFVDGNPFNLNPVDTIGKGGEADVYKFGNSKAIKIYKPPMHPDYKGLPIEQEGAKKRLQEQQTKLIDFPSGLPSNVIAPEKLAYSAKNVKSKIVGYVMRMLKGAEELRRYSDKSFRQTGVDTNEVIELFRRIYKLIDIIHIADVVIGDFSDLNVLVENNTDPYLIDADSMQFDKYLCHTFTNRFADPSHCDFNSSGNITLVRPHDENTDWYAYAVMLMQSLLFVDPFGGIYRPSDKTKRVPHNHRPLYRISVFNDEVIYPKPALPVNYLADDLVQEFIEIFTKDKRGKFEFKLLDNLRWTACVKCGTEHASNVCPNCALGPQTKPKEVTVIRGKVTATRIFKTDGIILHSVMQDKLRWLYHVDGKFLRENNNIVSTGKLNSKMRYRLTKDRTLLAIDQTMIVLSNDKPIKYDVNQYGTYPILDANSSHFFWMNEGMLCRNGPLDSIVNIGSILQNQSVFWVGEKFGLGFYRAGEINTGFVFNESAKSLNDNVQLNLGHGQLVDATCYFSNSLAWLFTCSNETGVLVNRCQVIDTKGKVLANREVEAGSDDWLGTLRAKTAIGGILFAAMDDGMSRIEINGSDLAVSSRFPDTENFVDTSCRLLVADDGIYAVSSQEITKLRIG
jgi:tRNA A-37 threonylcarbamoyl transferase component Bud32